MLKAILLGNKIRAKKKMLADLKAKDEEFEKREKELETAVDEMTEETSDEDRKIIEDEVDKFEEEKKSHEKSKEDIEKEIAKLEEELDAIEDDQNPTPAPAEPAKRKDGNKRGMTIRTKFFGMSIQERDAFFADDNVKEFLKRTREIATEKRDVKGAELSIPERVLDLVRENITKYSKLIKYVRLRSVSGKARQNIMGTIPEAVWTEMCGKLNELSFGFNQDEVDGYKVGGFIAICNATLQDSDYNLATEIISALGQAIGIALDKAIIYGRGTKMPQGIVTRLAQDSAPSDYPSVARDWENLSGNMITISSDKHGIEFFKEIVAAGGKAKGKYSIGTKFWAMNEQTLTNIKIEAMNFNAAGAIVSVMNGTMPVAGGNIEVLSDEIIPDGNIVSGYGDPYLLAEREGSTLAQSTECRFIEDQTVFKGSARYDGKPVIAEGFIAIGIGSAPQKSATFPGDTANDASLTDLTVSGATLSFNSTKYDYEVSVNDETVTANAVATQENAKITMKYDGKKVNNNSKLTTDVGGKNLEVTVKNGMSTLVYIVNIKKNGA